MADSAYEVITKETIGTAVASVTFSSIPQMYTDLVLVCAARTSRAATSDNLIVRFNSDSTAIYSSTNLFGDANGIGTARSSNDTSCFWSYIPSASQSAGRFGVAHMNIMNYANTNTQKTTISSSGNYAAQLELTANQYRSTSAISAITILSGTASNIAVGSTFTLYGIKAGS
jgi:hypothetical protein